ncbi:hypothetical protein UPYG_G00077480 [Umbra pygmaea]|uniref:Uncharacterized protein n=1 Tax=Umbra pygmaea TaxID=75934 RepID=A0ABD0XGG8_UMBPY
MRRYAGTRLAVRGLLDTDVPDGNPHSPLAYAVHTRYPCPAGRRGGMAISNISLTGRASAQRKEVGFHSLTPGLVDVCVLNPSQWLEPHLRRGSSLHTLLSPSSLEAPLVDIRGRS